MRNYKLGKSSIKNIKTINPALICVIVYGLHIANSRRLHCPDFGVSRGKSTAKEQSNLFSIGRKFDGEKWNVTGKTVTNCDGYKNLSNHQSGNAFDFFAYVNGSANYSDENIALIATVFFEASTDLGVKRFDWGGSFKSISDGAHFESSDKLTYEIYEKAKPFLLDYPELHTAVFDLEG